MIIGAAAAAAIGRVAAPTTQVYSVNSADLNGSTMYYDYGNTASYEFSGSYTIGIWYKRVTPVTGSSILGRINNGTNAGLSLDDNGTTLAFTHNNRGSSEGGYTQALVSATISDDTWYNVVVVFENGVSLRLYVDGVLQDTDTANNTPLVSNTQKFLVGS